MCFAPQPRALFRHLNCQKWSGLGVFLYMLTSKCASRHNGVHFFISHLARWFRARRFSEPTFRPSGATNHWKNTEFRDFPTFSRTCNLLSSDFLFSDLLSSTLLSSTLLFSLTLPIYAFHLSILSEVWLLNFLRLITGWWFGTCCIFPCIGNSNPNWLSCFSEELKPPARIYLINIIEYPVWLLSSLTMINFIFLYLQYYWTSYLTIIVYDHDQLYICLLSAPW